MPLTRTADGRADGSRIYQVYCINCHRDGTRGGPAQRLVGPSLPPEAELRAVIETGRGSMPAWKRPRGPLQDDEIAAVLTYLRTLPGGS